jgi:hypothetical protein
MIRDTKNINVEVSKDIWKKLKMISLDKEIEFHDVVRGILERAVYNKKSEITVPSLNE